MQISNSNIGFIGAGNMATALIEGLLTQGITPALLWASDADDTKLRIFADKGLHTTVDNTAVIAACDVVVLAVKPQVMPQVLAALAPALQSKNCLLISIAAGIRISSIVSATHADQAVVRCMPNTPALVQAGATALFANAKVSAEQKKLAGNIMEAVGMSCWLNTEAQLDAVTALSGSGPAYFFLLMEAMQNTGIALGLPADVSRTLCLQTAFGAAKLALHSDVDVAELRRRVTSPGGTTEAAIKQFEADDLHAIVARALFKAADKSKELSGN